MGKVTVAATRIDDDTIALEARLEGDGLMGDASDLIRRGESAFGHDFNFWEGVAHSRTAITLNTNKGERK